MTCGLRLLVLFVAAGALAAGDAHRDGLRRQAPPWYDAAADTWQPVDARDARDPSSPKPGAAKDVEQARRSGEDLAEERERSRSLELDAGGASTLVTVIAWILLGAVVVALVLFVIRAVLAARRRAPAPTPVAAAVPAVSVAPLAPLLGEALADPDAALAAARAAGDWARCVVLLYARHLLRLGACEAVILAPGVTDRAYLRQAERWAGDDPKRGVASAALAQLGRAFVAVRFGGAAVDAATVDRLSAIATAAGEAASGVRPVIGGAGP